MQVISESEVLRFYDEYNEHDEYYECDECEGEGFFSLAKKEEWVINGKAVMIEFDIHRFYADGVVLEANITPRGEDYVKPHRFIYDRRCGKVHMGDKVHMEHIELKSERFEVCHYFSQDHPESPPWKRLNSFLDGDFRKMPEWIALQKKLRNFKVMEVMKTEELEALRESVLGQKTKN